MAMVLLVTATSGMVHSPLTQSRRGFITSVPLCASTLLLPRAEWATAAEAPTAYTDSATGVSFAYPSDWELVKKTLDRSQPPLVIVTKGGAPSTNAVLSTNFIRGDYPSLGSFGSPADVLVNLIPPPGTPGVSSEVLSAQNKGKTYEFDYKLAFEQTGVTRHLRTVFGITHSPTGIDYLVTLTAQAEEQNYLTAKAELDAIVSSYKFV
jgi:hypothetical protein